MKNIMMALVCLAFLVQHAGAQAKNGLGLKYAEYGVSVAASLSGNPDADLVPFVVGKIDSLPKKQASSRFGLLFRDNAKSLATVPVFEILDGSGKVLKRVMLDEYFGKENASWKAVPAESKSNGTFNTAVFQIQTKGFSAKFVRELTYIDDANLPGGKAVSMAVSLESQTAQSVKVRFLARAEGEVSAYAKGFSIQNSDPDVKLSPSIAFFVRPDAQVQVEVTKKGRSRGISVATGDVQLTAGQKTSVFSMIVVGSSVRFGAFSKKQAELQVKYLGGEKAVPSMIQYIVANRERPMPGDTMTYTVFAHNIGNASAVEAAINNVIPRGADYIEGTATGTGTEITFSRTQVAPPAQPKVAAIKWMFKQEIKGGEERWVQYKVLVR